MMDFQVDLNMYLSNYLTIGNLSTMGFWKSAHFSEFNNRFYTGSGGN
jgi:hypothetical protein